MKKKLIVLGICLLSVLCFVSCGKPESQVAFEKEMTLMKKPSKEELKDMSIEEKQIMSLLYEKITYKINKVEEKKDTSNINVTFHVLNFPLYIGEFMQVMLPMAFTNPSEEAVNAATIKFFKELSERKDLKYIDKTIDVHMKKVDGEWVADGTNIFPELFSEGLGSILTPNLK